MDHVSASRRPRGFTLVELLVTLSILAVLATLTMVGTRKALESARMAANLSNLRNAGSILMCLESDNGAFPPGYNWSTGLSWASLVVNYKTSGRAKQDKIVLSPVVAREIPPQLNSETISNYGVNPMIFPDNEVINGSVSSKYQTAPLRLLRPHQQILLGDALPRAAKVPYGQSMGLWWALRGGPTGNTWANPPIASPATSERKITLPANLRRLIHDSGAGLPAFRNNGKGHFFFGDGHVEALVQDELKQKHFAVSY